LKTTIISALLCITGLIAYSDREHFLCFISILFSSREKPWHFCCAVGVALLDIFDFVAVYYRCT
jgi:hypothetical protein